MSIYGFKPSSVIKTILKEKVSGISFPTYNRMNIFLHERYFSLAKYETIYKFFRKI